MDAEHGREYDLVRVAAPAFDIVGVNPLRTAPHEVIVVDGEVMQVRPIETTEWDHNSLFDDSSDEDDSE